MPVEELKSSVFAVSQPVLKIRPDGTRALDFSGSMEIDTYVLCFRKMGRCIKIRCSFRRMSSRAFWQEKL